MQLRRLRVKNIRSYESGALDFAPGTTLLVGDVGAGKTSLLYAIEMALFGVAEVDAAYLVRHGAAHSEVTVGFEDAEHAYEISRRFRRVRRKGKETFEPEKIGFTVDGAATAYSATELRQRVIDLLGFPDNPNPQAHSDLWRWAVYVPQERMRDILGARPQERLETVRKALGVERYRTAAENAADLATDLRRSANGRRAEAERLHHYDLEFAEWTATGDRLRLERTTLEGALDRKVRELGEARRAVEERSSRLRRTEADRRELESLTREQESDAGSIESKAEERRERVEAGEARQREAEALREIAGRLGPLRTELGSHDAAIAELSGKLQAASARRAELHAAQAELDGARRAEGDATRAAENARQELGKAEASLQAARQEGPAKEPPAPIPESVARIEEQLAEAVRREGELVAASARARVELSEVEELLRAGICPRCHQKVTATEFSRHAEEARAEVERVDGRLRAAGEEREALETARRSRERYERAHDRWIEVERRREDLAEALRRSTSAAGQADRALIGAQTRTGAARARVESLGPIETEESTFRARLEEAEARRNRLSSELERAVIAGERLRSIADAQEELRSTLDRLDREVETLRRRVRDRGARVADLAPVAAGARAVALELEAAEAAERAAESALEGDRLQLARLDARLDEAVRSVGAAERGRSERSALLAEADTLERQAAWIARPFREAVLTMEQRVLAHAQAEFERHFARYFASLVDDAALVARTDVAFTPAVTIEGEWTPAEALSGGERTSLALAFRLALAQVVRSLGDLRLDTVLLDEPTDGFSPEQVVRMGELLDELSLPQVVIVSHEGQLAAIADRVVRVEKRDGRSELALADSPAAGPPEDAGDEPVS